MVVDILRYETGYRYDNPITDHHLHPFGAIIDGHDDITTPYLGGHWYERATKLRLHF